ncbi:MAG: group 1 truncated hemoglobin [Acidobacteriales bacterium]|nr:group 1 truncated hemoglobin [Terriglobales bacterium]
MSSEAKSQASLFTRIGGHDGIQSVVDDFVARMTAHPQVGRFFAGLDTSSGSKFRSHLVDFISAATGGGTNYRGRDMASAHRAFDISESDWEVTVGNLKASLQKARLPGREIQDVVEVIAPLKKQIVKHSL